MYSPGEGEGIPHEIVQVYPCIGVIFLGDLKNGEKKALEHKLGRGDLFGYAHPPGEPPKIHKEMTFLLYREIPQNGARVCGKAVDTSTLVFVLKLVAFLQALTVI